MNGWDWRVVLGSGRHKTHPEVLSKKLCKPIDEAILHISAKFDAHKFDLV